MAMSALALASCSEDEPVSVRQNLKEAISFRSGMATRATETTNANLSKIFVTAFAQDTTSSGAKATGGYDLYFNNAEFDKGSDSFFQGADGKEYDWLSENGEIKFFSYSPSQDELGADIIEKDDQPGLSLVSFSPAEDIGKQVDFITATASGTRKANGSSGVELTFDHRLSQIEIQGKSENTTYTYKVLGAKIGRAEYLGDFDFNTNKWTLDSWHDKLVYTTSCDTTTLTATPQSLMGPSGNAMLLPQTLTIWNHTGDPDNAARGSYLGVLIEITRKDNGFRVFPYPDNKGNKEYDWVSVPLSGTWEQGKKYIYTLDFTNGAGYIDPDGPDPGKPVLGPIQFNVTVNDWIEEDMPTSMATDA